MFVFISQKPLLIMGNNILNYDKTNYLYFIDD